MTEVPKIVVDRLRATRPECGSEGQPTPEPAHLDANLLAAFVEQTLSATERDGVLEHLALCKDCCEVVTLTLPDANAAVAAAMDTEVDTEAVRATATAPKSQWNWLSSPKLAWPSLRWAALAAGVALAASVLLLHPGRRNQAMLPTANEVAPTVLPAPSSQIASSPAPSSSAGQASISPNAASVNSDSSKTTAQSRPPMKLKAAPPLPVQSGMLLAYNNKSSSLGGKRRAAASPAASSFRAGDSAPRSSTGTVEVPAATEAVRVEPSPQPTLMARNEIPSIKKAKPPLQDGQGNELQNVPTARGGASAGASAMVQGRNALYAAKMAPSAAQALAPNLTWTIKDGVLQRSLDSGQSWQSALHTDHPLLCYAHREADVWAGGQAGLLFHSTDNGLTWLRVQPSSKAQGLTSDITRIDIRGQLPGPVTIVVSTDGNDVWTSADGGKTWDKK